MDEQHKLDTDGKESSEEETGKLRSEVEEEGKDQVNSIEHESGN